MEDGLRVAVSEGFYHLEGIVTDLSLLDLSGLWFTFWFNLEKRHFPSAYSKIRHRSFPSLKKP